MFGLLPGSKQMPCRLPRSYDGEGRLMNVTFPTGMVNNLYTDIYSTLTVDIESSMTEEEISITTNTSTIRAFYTLAQGKAAAALVARRYPS